MGAPTHNPNDTPIGDNPYIFTSEQGESYFWDFSKSTWILSEDIHERLDEPDQPTIVFDPDDEDYPNPLGKRGVCIPDINKIKQAKTNKTKLPQGNTTIYIENLPTDTDLMEVESFFSRAGIIKKDPYTGDLFIKLYTCEDDATKLKGDARITYFRPESVKLAIELFDGTSFRYNHPNTLTISEAKFEKSKQKKKKKTGDARKKKKIRFDQSKDLSWDEENRVHIILKGLFDPKESWTDPNFVTDLKEDVKEECSKFGEVSLVNVFEHNPEGVVAVKFKEPAGALKCIEVMDGRWFAKRQISAIFYDGFTNYRVEESEEAKAARMLAWQKYLEENETE